MNFSTCCCAPAPIDIIDTTSATPKIIPSMVSSERSLWTINVSRPRRQSVRIWRPVPSVSLAVIGVIGRRPASDPEERASSAGAWHRPGRRGALRALVEDVGVHERDVGVGGEVLQHDTVFRDADDL